MRVLNPLLKFLAVAGVAILAACEPPSGPGNSSLPPTSQDWQQASNMNDEFGGLGFTNEKPAFGDPQVAGLDGEENDLAYADTDTDSVPAPNDSTFVLRILWGQLQGNPQAATTIDWSGNVHLSRGRLVVLRTVAFEPPGDHLMFPRPDPQTVAFVSHTQPSFDGILLLVRDAPGSDPTTLTLTTPPFTRTLTLAELKTANLVLPVDAEGNAVSFTGIPPRPPGCPSGFTRGHWFARRDSTMQNGVGGFFRGLWLQADLHHGGHIRGHYGVNGNGERIWFGKILGRDGRVIGLARGTWQPNADETQPGGTFAGRWFVRPGTPGGEVAGHYLPGRDDAAGPNHHVPGFFEGRWRAECGTAP